MDELIINPRRILHHHVRRRTLRRISATCVASARLCRQRQLLGRRSALGWGALAGFITAVGVGFAGGARWTAVMPRKRSFAASGSPLAGRGRARRHPVMSDDADGDPERPSDFIRPK